MTAFEEIEKTIRIADNECTDSPYWLIIEPRGRNIKTRIEDIANCITGPFFSREDAENHLKTRRYNFSDKARVWCFSGYWSEKYKNALRNIK